MRKIYLLLFLFFALFSAAQTQKPVPSGSIVVSTGQKMNFRTLKFHDDMVTFINTATNSEYTYFLKNVKVIQDANAVVIYKEGDSIITTTTPAPVVAKTTVSDKPREPELLFRNCDRTIYNGKILNPAETKSLFVTNTRVLKTYNSGRTMNIIGDIVLGTGIGVVVGTGIRNIRESNAARENSNYQKSNYDSSGIMIVGLSMIAIGIPMKIAGRAKVKAAIAGYNADKNRRVGSNLRNCDIIFTAGQSGAGLLLKW